MFKRRNQATKVQIPVRLGIGSVLILFSFFACKKDNNTPPAPPPAPNYDKVKQYQGSYDVYEKAYSLNDANYFRPDQFVGDVIAGGEPFPIFDLSVINGTNYSGLILNDSLNVLQFSQSQRPNPPLWMKAPFTDTLDFKLFRIVGDPQRDTLVGEFSSATPRAWIVSKDTLLLYYDYGIINVYGENEIYDIRQTWVRKK